MKQLAVQVARANGWEADTEVAEGEWLADVLARKVNAKVAVEIQWSPQRTEETLRRQARYEEAGIRGLWLLRQSDFPEDHSLPAAGIGGSPEEGFVAITGRGGQRVPMRDFLEAAFTKRLRFGVPLGFTANVSVRAGHMFCWKCGAETQIITGINVSYGPNDYDFSVPDLGDYPDLFDLIRNRLSSEPWIGAIKRRYSNTQERSYLSNGCSHCDALIGQFFEHEAWDDQQEVCVFTVLIDQRWRRALQADHAGGWGVYPPG